MQDQVVHENVEQVIRKQSLQDQALIKIALSKHGVFYSLSP